MEGRIVFVHGLTPIHTGTGQSVDVIDLPVAREKVTNWPYIPGSSIKGVLRDAYNSRLTKADIELIFGPEEVKDNNAKAGCILFSDARLLCLPVRSFYGTFAWITCPSAVQRLVRDFEGCHQKTSLKKIKLIDYGKAIVSSSSILCKNNKVFFEDLDVEKVSNSNADELASAIADLVFSDPNEKQSFIARFAVVSDDLFTTLTETSTEVVARIRIDDKSKTAADAGLRYEEAVPSESLFWFPLIAAPRNSNTGEELLGKFSDSNWVGQVQIGGNATVGRGIVRLIRWKQEV